MIDTIRVKIKVEKFNADTFVSLACYKAGNLKFKIFKDQVKLGSFSYDVNLFVNSYNYLIIEFSVPKLLHGNNINVSTFDDITTALLCIKDSLNDRVNLQDVETWEVLRLDLCKYINSDDVYRDIVLYQSLLYPRKKKYIYDTSIMFVGNSFSTKVYIKHDEFLKNDYKKIYRYDVNKALRLLEDSKGLLRVETTYRSKALKNIIGIDKVSVSDIIKNKDKIIAHNKKVNDKILANSNIKKMQQLELLKLLNDKYKPARAMQLYQFWLFYISDDNNKKLTRMYYSRSQIYRNLKIISDLFKFS